MKLTDFVSTLYTDESVPSKLTVALTMVNQALQKGYSSTLILLVDAVKIAHKDYQLTTDIGLPFLSVEKLMSRFLSLGCQVAVCKSCIEHNHILLEDINAHYTIITANDVIDLLMNARGSLQNS